MRNGRGYSRPDYSNVHFRTTSTKPVYYHHTFSFIVFYFTSTSSTPLPRSRNTPSIFALQLVAETYECVCVCVCVFSSHSFWTSSSLDVPAGVTQEEGHTGFLIHLLSAVRAFIFLARRIQLYLSFVDREVEFCVLTI